MGCETKARRLRHAGCVGIEISQIRFVNCESQFDRDGFQTVPELVSAQLCDQIVNEFSQSSRPSDNRSRRGGIRNALRLSPTAKSVANSPEILSLISQWIGGTPFPVRAILFNKTNEANWGVPWHQDLAIAVAERVELPGFSAWSVKDGVLHVNPPVSVLEGMVTMRLHLDDCSDANGALRILPGSHREGELSNEAISRWAQETVAVTCELRKGGALFMRPLLLHASSPAKNPSHRRVLHVEYAAKELPHGLKWAA